MISRSLTDTLDDFSFVFRTQYPAHVTAEGLMHIVRLWQLKRLSLAGHLYLSDPGIVALSGSSDLITKLKRCFRLENAVNLTALNIAQCGTKQQPVTEAALRALSQLKTLTEVRSFIFDLSQETVLLHSLTSVVCLASPIRLFNSCCTHCQLCAY